MFVLFNQNKEFIAYSPVVPSEHLLAKFIPEHQQNLQFWKWQGDFDTGKMVSVYDLTEEYSLEESLEELELLKKFEQEYPQEKIIHLLISQLYKLSFNTEYEHEEFLEMAEKWLLLIDKQKTRLKYLKSNLHKFQHE